MNFGRSDALDGAAALQDPNKTIMSYSLAILRGLAVETEAQELFPSMGRGLSRAASCRAGKGLHRAMSVAGRSASGASICSAPSIVTSSVASSVRSSGYQLLGGNGMGPASSRGSVSASQASAGSAASLAQSLRSAGGASASAASFAQSLRSHSTAEMRVNIQPISDAGSETLSSCWRLLQQHFGGQQIDWSEYSHIAYMRDGEGQVVGAACLRVLQEGQGQPGGLTIRFFCVERRGQGLGRQFFQAIAQSPQFAQNAPIGVNSSAEAVGFWERMRFQPLRANNDQPHVQEFRDNRRLLQDQPGGQQMLRSLRHQIHRPGGRPEEVHMFYIRPNN
eukprot:Skav204384  [mRNA]  locus=scaffold4897:225839:227969:- [translate_table: standard]